MSSTKPTQTKGDLGFCKRVKKDPAPYVTHVKDIFAGYTSTFYQKRRRVIYQNNNIYRKKYDRQKRIQYMYSVMVNLLVFYCFLRSFNYSKDRNIIFIH